MDPSSADRRHLTWRDLPPSPPVEPAPTSAVPAAIPVAAAGMPTASSVPARHTRARWLATFAAGLLAGAILLVGAGLVTGSVDSAHVNDALANASNVLGGGANGGGNGAPNAGGSNGSNGSSATPAPGTAGDEPIADAAAKLSPAVVQIETTSGLGAGFIADPAGYILTASHVVGGESTVTVRLKDGTTMKGDVVAADRTIDTAVVKVAQQGLPVATLGSSANVRVGQTAIAIGSPFGFDQTVTKGIISGLDRTLDTEVGQLTGLIQTDAPINQGNSGGPLADKDANVIGINTAIASQTGGSNGVGFAIPIDTAKELLQKVKDGSWTAADNQPFDSGSSIPGLGDIPGLGQIPDLNQLFGPNSPLGPDGLFGPNGLFGDPNQTTPNGTDPNGTTPNGGTGDSSEQLFRWLFNYVLPQLVPGTSGNGGN
jgi:S1-C subfamily serine protease